MTDEEVEVVASELAKAGGVSWHSGPARGPLKVVMNRYRERARLAIAALERIRSAKHDTSRAKPAARLFSRSATVDREINSHDGVTVGSLVLYRPPGDRRVYPCRIAKLEGTRAYLVPDISACTGWVDVDITTPLPVQ